MIFESINRLLDIIKIQTECNRDWYTILYYWIQVYWPIKEIEIGDIQRELVVLNPYKNNNLSRFELEKIMKKALKNVIGFFNHQ